MDDAARLRAQLAPLADALADAARADAEKRLQDARDRAAAIREDADARAKAVLAKAAAEGEAAAERQSARRLVEAKRQARRRVLEARRRAYDALLEAAVAAAVELRGRPEHAALQERLAGAATAALGADATVERDPGGRGGVVARSDGRSLDLTLPVLARRCLGAMGKEVVRLWT